MSSRDIVFSAAGAGGDVNYIDDVFSTYLYTGNSSTQTITNGIDLAGKGGLVWVKQRGPAGNNHQLADTVRGASSQLASNTTAAATSETNRFTSFNSDGFSLDSGTIVNNSTQTYCSWTFREQAKFFDVVTYTGNGSAPRDIAHSLGSSPGFIIIKRTNSTGDWWCWHRSIANKNIYLNYTDAADSGANPMISAVSSTNFTLATNQNATMNINGATYVAYLFAHDAGGFGAAGTDNVISCGRYTGTGSAGLNVNLGYEPQYVLVKSASSSIGPWIILDVMRDQSNTSASILEANASGAEYQLGSAQGYNNGYIVPNATGFTIQATSNAYVNTSGDTYIYMAIRRPMKPPTSGTQVFSPVYGQSGAPGFRSSNFNAGIDTSFVFLTSGYNDGTNAYQNLQARLTGLGQLQTGNARAEVSQSYNTWDYMNGQNNTTFYSPPWGSWMFKRAPGFHDVVCYTGTGANRTVAHNLGAVPELMIVKARNDTTGWFVYSKGVNGGVTPEQYFLTLNGRSAAGTASEVWNDTAPTSSVFSLGTNSSVNGSGFNYVAYLFASVAGVSKVGSYTGNGSSQTINCGFTSGARFVLIKRTDAAGDWYVWDTTRGMVAGTNPSLTLNTYAAEVNANSVYTTTTGFQLLASPAVPVNTSGASYIFLAIA